jgi:hypothetical protein
MRNGLVITTLLAVLAGCKNPGLPPEPPEHDATNPDAGLVEHRPQPSPFERSAFEGVELGGGGHDHHHHHGHGATAPAAGAKATERASPDPHAGHGSHGAEGGAR